MKAMASPAAHAHGSKIDNAISTRLIPAPSPAKSRVAAVWQTLTGGGSKNAPVVHAAPLMGDALLDGYKTDLDLLSDEVSDLKARLKGFAQAIVQMADQATQVALIARQIGAEAQSCPPSLLGFADAHEEWCISARTLFEEEFHIEVLEPLEMWEEEAGQFLRELTRTNEARIKQMGFKMEVDKLFLDRAELQENAEMRGEEDDEGDNGDADLEFRLKIAKTDLDQSCTNYTGRCSGLIAHWAELSSGRIQALDVSFTRFMTQQHFFFRPGMRIVDQELYSGGGGGGSGTPGGTMSPPRLSSGGSSTPTTTRQRLNSLAGLAPSSPVGLMMYPPVASAIPSSSSSSTASRGPRSAYEEDIIRTSRRINRKSYQSQVVHYHKNLNTSSTSTLMGMGMGGDGSNDDHQGQAPDLHHSLRTKSRVATSVARLPKAGAASTKAEKEQAAILEACRQLQIEMNQRKNTEETNEKLRAQIELLTARASGAGSDAVGAEENLKAEIEQLRRQVASLEAPKPPQPPAEEKKEDQQQIVAPDAPPAPAMDAPMAPPLFNNVPDAPPPPGAPSISSHPHGSPSAIAAAHARRPISAREKEKDEAHKWNLPLLPAISTTILNPLGTDPQNRVVLKKLHWAPCTPEDFMQTQPQSHQSSHHHSKHHKHQHDQPQQQLDPTQQQQQQQSNVWKDLFMRANHAAESQQQQLTSIESKDDEIELPLIPHVESSTESTAAIAADPNDSSTTVSTTSSTTATPAPRSFDWRYDIDAPSFALLFAQKATVAMKKKGSIIASNKPNKYALGRKGLKKAKEAEEAARIAAGGSPRAAAAAAAGEDEHDDEEAGVDEDEADEDTLSNDDNNDASDDDSSTSSRNKMKKKSKKSSSLSPSPPLVRVELIDAKRSYNVQISLSHFRLSPLAIREAIMNLDCVGPPTISGEALEILADILPTPEEAGLVLEWVHAGGAHDPSHLGEVEKFFLAMSTPGLRDRLKLLLFLDSFSSVTGRLEDLLAVVHKALSVLAAPVTRKHIAIVLSIVLRMGNLMNATAMTMVPVAAAPTTASNARINASPVAAAANSAGALVKSSSKSSSSSSTSIAVAASIPIQSTKQMYGFFLPATLSKLRGVKSLDGKTTLLHFLVRYVSERIPIRAAGAESTTITNTIVNQLLPPMRECARIEQAFLLAEVKQLRQHLALCKALIEEDEKQLKRAAENGTTTTIATTIVATAPIAAAADLFSPTSPSSSSTSSSALSPCPSPSPSSSAASAGAASASTYIPLPARVHEFYSYASDRLDILERLVGTVRSLHSDLQAYYLFSGSGGSERDTNPWESFAALWTAFATDWAQADEEINEETAAAEKKIRQIEAAKLMKQRREEGIKQKAAAALLASTAAAIAATETSSTASAASASTAIATPSADSHSLIPPTHPTHPTLSSSSVNASPVAPSSFAKSFLQFISPGRGEKQAAAVAAAAPTTSTVQGDFSSMGSSPPPPTA